MPGLEVLLQYVSRAIVLLLALPVHECAHGWVAYKLGDPTAKNEGRLTLNPFKHLDLFGSLMILLVGIGYAKPVPINPYYFKNRKYGMALTALAGPMSNLIMAYLAMIVMKVIWLLNSVIL
ncbi:MAG TPA: site-2 protease family protein, partial [Firmicutes bacterium]|nr:site-2 protease family protein [Bacillota bacterium]